MSERSDPGPDPDDDAALRWAGDEGRGMAAPRRAAGTDGRIGTDGRTGDAGAEGYPGADRAESAETGSADAERASAAVGPAASAGGLSASRTAATVVFAIVYLVIVVGWVLSVQVTGSGSTDLFVEISWQFGEFMAMVAGALWFAVVLVLSRGRRTLVAVGGWALGALVLVPWPFALLVLESAS